MGGKRTKGDKERKEDGGQVVSKMKKEKEEGRKERNKRMRCI